MVIYLDHAASTRLRPAALETMTRLFTDGYGNPSGAHRMARAANRVLDEARETMAAAFDARPGEIVFTSGGTESDNLAIFGALDAARSGGNPGCVAVCSAIEHHAVLDVVQHTGGRTVGVDRAGRLDLAELAAVLDETPDVAVVSVMSANNETGIIQPLDSVADVVHRHAPRALLHTDAVQAFSWVDVAEVCRPADLITVSAHKFGGPQGVGVLVVRDGVTIEPRARGGGQERERRSGTQNVPGIAGMAVAAAETVAERSEAVARVGALRDRLADGLRARIDGVHESGIDDPGGTPDAGPADRSAKTANICHVCFEGIESEALLFLLEKDDVMASAAASCSSGAMEPSHVLAAMGFSRALAFGSLRLSLGSTTTEADVDRALDVVCDSVQRLRDRR